jgi:hypothetical protein
MVTNLVRFGGRTVKNLCNFYATLNKPYRLPVLGCKQDSTFVSKEEI